MLGRIPLRSRRLEHERLPDLGFDAGESGGGPELAYCMCLLDDQGVVEIQQDRAYGSFRRRPHGYMLAASDRTDLDASHGVTRCGYRTTNRRTSRCLAGTDLRRAPGGRTHEPETSRDGHSMSWRSRPATARAVALGIVAVPVAGAVGIAVLVELFVPEPVSSFGLVAWWIGVIRPVVLTFVVASMPLAGCCLLRYFSRWASSFRARRLSAGRCGSRAGNTPQVAMRIAGTPSEAMAHDPATAAEDWWSWQRA